MTELSHESIKNLNKDELKIELTNRGLGTQGTKYFLLNRLSKAMQDMDTRNRESESRNKANEMGKSTSNTRDASVSIELVKEIFTNLFKEQEEKLLNIVRNGISDTNAYLDRLTQEISDNNIKLNDLSKETDDLKLSIETSQEITDEKFKEINKKLKMINNNMLMKLMSYGKKMNIFVKS